MFPVKIVFLLSGLFIFCIKSSGQQSLTVDEIITLAFQQSPLLKASETQVKHDLLLEKAAWNIPDPEFLLESPTGDFMTLGVQQSIEFPTVYTRRKQLAKQQTALSEKAIAVNQAQVKWKVKEMYLQLQYAIALLQQHQKQDSLFNAISISASRQYQAGQIDFVEKTFADVRYTEIHTQLLSSEAGVRSATQQLQGYTGMTDDIIPTPLALENADFEFTNHLADSNAMINAPVLKYYRQTQTIAEKSIQLESSKALPDLTVGYLNQADHNTPTSLRLRVGISVPLWYWQYKSTIHAAKSSLEIARYTTESAQQDLTMQWYQAKNDALKYHSVLSYYETEGLRQADDIIEASGRMFSAGQYDYVKYLTTLSEAYRIQQQYLDLLKNYNHALIQLQFLIGQ